MYHYKDKKVFAADLKTIYLAPSEEQGRDESMRRVQRNGKQKYPNAMKSWEQNWDVISPIFKFSTDVRRAIYTTNAIESLNSSYKRLNSQRSVFPSDKALLKALYLSTLQATKKWTQKIRNWGKIYGEFSIMYPGRMPESYYNSLFKCVLKQPHLKINSSARRTELLTYIFY